MSINREAALKQAEKLLRQGKLDGAIEEYVRLIDDQPRDWNSSNVLGDLYMRAGQADRAVEQFIRVADHLFAEGFFPKAAALYKKALKVQGQHEHALSQLAETAIRQKLLADARMYLRQLEQVRRLRGEERRADECLERIRALDDTEIEGAPAPAPAPEPTPPAAQPEPAPVPSADDAGQLFARAERELDEGQEMTARATLTRVLTLDPERHADVMRLALALAGRGRIESAFGCVDVLTDAALLSGEWNQAAEALQTFVREVPHIPALIKLVEISVDAGLETPLREAQAQLADAYLDAGRGEEARVISEDLLEREPDSEDHAGRLRRALALLGDQPSEPAPSTPEAVEIDLSAALADLMRGPAGSDGQ